MIRDKYILRNGDAHSADEWQRVLILAVERYAHSNSTYLSKPAKISVTMLLILSTSKTSFPAIR
jgi:hypothetical protein